MRVSKIVWPGLVLFSLILLIALLRTERRNRQLLREIQATVVC